MANYTTGRIFSAEHRRNLSINAKNRPLPERFVIKDKLFAKGFKICSQCENKLNISKFSRSRTSKDGLYFYCKDCKEKERIRHIKKYPHKNKAHILFRIALGKGLIIKPESCEHCGVKNPKTARGSALQGHHFDYSKPLEVMWLCSFCHRKQHILEKQRMSK